MDIDSTDVWGACYSCGAMINHNTPICPHCGMPVLTNQAPTGTMPREYANLGQAVPSTGSGPALSVPVLNKRVQSGFAGLSKRAAVAVGAGLAVVLVGAVACFVLWPGPATPSSTVEDYFAYLSKNQVDKALDLVYSEGEDWDTDPLLTSQALAEEDNRPTNLKVTATEAGVSYEDLKSYEVDVTYEVGEATVSQAFSVIEYSGDETEYRIYAPFLYLDINDSSSRSITVNGISLADDQLDSLCVFPGLYTATAAGNVLLAEDKQQATIDDSAFGGSLYATIEFSQAALAEGAEEAVREQVKEKIDTCAESTESWPDDCPFYLYSWYSDSSVVWSITAYPTYTVSVADSEWLLSSGPVVISGSDDDGIAHYTETYTDYSGAVQTETEDVEFSVNGYASISGQDIVVSID